MSTGTRLRLADAEALLGDLLPLVQPACSQLVVAGSVRRRKETVGDLEIVCTPRYLEQASLFGDAPGKSRVDLLDEVVTTLIGQGVLADRLNKLGHAARGERYKRLSFRGTGVDLFCSDADRFGLVLAIRTGPAEWSKRLVTRQQFGGYLPNHMQVSGGQLWQAVVGKPMQPVATPTEAALFAAIGLSWVEPEARR